MDLDSIYTKLFKSASLIELYKLLKNPMKKSDKLIKKPMDKTTDISINRK